MSLLHLIIAVMQGEKEALRVYVKALLQVLYVK